MRADPSGSSPSAGEARVVGGASQCGKVPVRDCPTGVEGGDPECRGRALVEGSIPARSVPVWDCSPPESKGGDPRCRGKARVMGSTSQCGSVQCGIAPP